MCSSQNETKQRKQDNKQKARHVRKYVGYLENIVDTIHIIKPHHFG